MPAKDQDLGTGNTALLKKIRQRYRYGLDRWRKVRDDGQKNMRYIAGDPWDEQDKLLRAGRPTVCPDELNQYVNQVVNTARENPRGVKVDPAGDDATEELAEYRENRIRAIEYACSASQAYINGLQGAVERNIGYWKVSRGYVSDESDEQEILILPIQNPDNILIDPDFKQLDASDIKWAFELDRMPLDDFEAEFPDAEKRSFVTEDFGPDASLWLDEKTILVASYWEIKTEPRKVGNNGRVVHDRKIQQYITNGIEILKKSAQQPGPYIPIVPVLSKELWVDYGSGAERVLISLVTLARDPQKALAYIMSSMLETCGQVAKARYVGAVGQFETDSERWDNWNSQYSPYLQFDMVTDASGQPVPRPELVQMTPPFQEYAAGADMARRAIQAAMGISPLPTPAQRQNEKSGAALSKIQSEQSIGSYHLVDSYDRAIKLTGRIINPLISVIDVGEGSRPVREADGTHKLVKINTDQPVEVDGHQYHFPIADDNGRYQITISSGPSHESQREEASEFVDTMVANLKNLPIAAPQAAKVLALAIRLKQLGPLGDQMADIISPQDNSQQQLGQMQQQMAQMQQQLQEVMPQLQKLLLERQGKVIEMQGKAHLAMLDHVAAMQEADKDRETKIAVAEIGTKAQIASERSEAVDDMFSQFHGQAHEAALSAQEHAQQQQLAQQQAAAQQAQQAQAGQQQSAQSAQEFEQQQAAQPAEGESQ
jgi:hypothetical protein